MSPLTVFSNLTNACSVNLLLMISYGAANDYAREITQCLSDDPLCVSTSLGTLAVALSCVFSGCVAQVAVLSFSVLSLALPGGSFVSMRGWSSPPSMPSHPTPALLGHALLQPCHALVQWGGLQPCSYE